LAICSRLSTHRGVGSNDSMIICDVVVV
jgi:hypothetical protein